MNTAKLVKVQDHPHLVKDMESKAILNTNYAALLEYKRRKQMEDEVNSLKEDVQDIKQTLNMIVSMLNK
jgi:hypothetical protein